MPKTQHTAPRWLKPMNKVFLLLQRLGGMKQLPVLVVAGRRTGKPRRTPLRSTTVSGVRLVELSADQAVPVLRAWPELAGTDGPKMMKDAGVVDDVTPEAFAAAAGRCAVFRIDPR